LISPDHPTPIELRTHTNDPVPFLISGYGIEKGNFSIYSEKEALNSNLYFKTGKELIEYFLKV
jgi:2,3-bisphosphoglycerate-independent phosphoglycerate mutase